MKSIIEAYKKVLGVDQPTVQVVTETTVPEDLHHIPESWNHHSEVSDETYAKMKSALKHGSFTHFPLSVAHGEADPDVVEHLTNHGYSIKDYVAGIATIKKHVGDPSRGIPLREKHVDEKIGSILERTNASPEIKTSFMNDPIRQATKAPTHVVISTSPLAIAGMTTGTAWANHSCMNLTKGMYRHKLADDSEHGTHVAYLVHHDDHTAFKYGEPSKPIARIALKPFHDRDGDTIFRSENTVWGADNTAFKTSVDYWASQNYPAKAGQEYYKNRHVYDDTGDDIYKSIGRDEMHRALEEGDHLGDVAIDHHIIDSGLSHIAKHFDVSNETDPAQKANKEMDHALALSRMAYITNLSTAHIVKMKRQLDGLTEPKADQNKSLALEEMLRLHGDKLPSSMLKGYDEYPTYTMMMNPKLPGEVVDKIAPKDYSFVRRSHLKQKHIDKLVEASKSQDFDGAHRRTINDLRDHLSSDNLHSLIKSDPSIHSESIINAKNFNKEHHDALVHVVNTQHAGDVKVDLLQASKFTKFEDTQRMPSTSMYRYLLKNPHITHEDTQKVKDEFMKNATGGNPDAKPTRFGIQNVLGFNGNTMLSEKVSRHLKHEDYKKLAEHNYVMHFENRDHSNKFLDAAFDHAKKMDASIDEHISRSEEKDSDYDRDTDPEIRAMDNRLHNHIANYAKNIDNHIDLHVVDRDSNLKDGRELEKTLGRLTGSRTDPARSLDVLEHYNTPGNSSRYDHEHYDDNFATPHERLSILGREDYEIRK